MTYQYDFTSIKFNEKGYQIHTIVYMVFRGFQYIFDFCASYNLPG